MVWSLFVCAKCGGRKPISGRTKYKKTGAMKDGRPIYSYQCKQCTEEERMTKCHSR